MVGLTDCGEGLYLIHCAFLKLAILVKLVTGDDLYGVLVVGFYVFSAVNFAVIALADYLQQGVVVDHFDHFLCVFYLFF